MGNSCSTWVNTSVKWRDANWWWSGCALIMQSTCSVWDTSGTFWMDMGALWSDCSGSAPIPPVPPVEVTGSLQPLGVDATTLIQPWLIEPWNPYRAGETKKRLIKLICRVDGETYMEEKELGDMEISIDDIKMMVAAKKGIDLNVGNVK